MRSVTAGWPIMQPQRKIFWRGWRRLVCVRAPTLPKTRCSACSRMAQVFITTMSAPSDVSVKP